MIAIILTLLDISQFIKQFFNTFKWRSIVLIQFNAFTYFITFTFFINTYINADCSLNELNHLKFVNKFLSILAVIRVM